MKTNIKNQEDKRKNRCLSLFKLNWELDFFVGDKYEINSQNCESKDIQNSFVHHLSPFGFSYPEKDNKCQYAGQKIKGQKIHTFIASVFDIFTAITRNNIVMAMPATNVSQGVLPVAPGTNTPMTKDANIIFEPSKKNSDTTFNSSLLNIEIYFNTEKHLVKDNFVYNRIILGTSPNF